MARIDGFLIKKQFGQHFLRDDHVIENMIDAVILTDQTSVFEIGCGDGVLTKAIIRTGVARLWVFEIDPEWAAYVKKLLPDPRLRIFKQDFLQVQPVLLEPYKPWVLLANLPYQVTFPILHWLQEHRFLLTEGVVMVQEEVAQKIVKTRGKGYGYKSLFFQRFFEWRLLDKVPPSAFLPSPKVFSRLLYFKPKKDICLIPDEPLFWLFIERCFKQPRRTLKNNLEQGSYNLQAISHNVLKLRAQELSMDELLAIWLSICRARTST